MPFAAPVSLQVGYLHQLFKAYSKNSISLSIAPLSSPKPEFPLSHSAKCEILFSLIFDDIFYPELVYPIL